MTVLVLAVLIGGATQLPTAPEPSFDELDPELQAWHAGGSMHKVRARRVWRLALPGVWPHLLWAYRSASSLWLLWRRHVYSARAGCAVRARGDLRALRRAIRVLASARYSQVLSRNLFVRVFEYTGAQASPPTFILIHGFPSSSFEYVPASIPAPHTPFAATLLLRNAAGPTLHTLRAATHWFRHHVAVAPLQQGHRRTSRLCSSQLTSCCAPWGRVVPTGTAVRHRCWRLTGEWLCGTTWASGSATSRMLASRTPCTSTPSSRCSCGGS